jgi:hypothetical protein
MFEQLLHVAKHHLRRFLIERVRGARALRDWFQELGTANKSGARGLMLLREWLSREQLAQYDANSYFDVIGCDSGRQYRIHQGISMNIHEIDGTGHPRVGWCFVPNGSLVPGDVMLAQKIALETDERGALAVAKQFDPTRRNVFVPY